MVLSSTPIKNHKIDSKRTKISELDSNKMGKGKVSGKGKMSGRCKALGKGKGKKAENVKPNITKKQKEQCSFLICTEEYMEPPTENWIQCSQCRCWDHENCTLCGG